MALTQHILLPKGNLMDTTCYHWKTTGTTLHQFGTTWALEDVLGTFGHYLCNTWELHLELLGRYLGTSRALRTSCGLLEYLVNPLRPLRDHLQTIVGAYLCPIGSMAIVSGQVALCFPLDFVQAIISRQRPDDWFLTATTPPFAKKMRK